MLDEKDLMSIAQLIDQKLSQQKEEILGEMGLQMARQKEEILGEMGLQIARQKEEILGEMGLQMAQQKKEILDKMAQQKKEILMESTHNMKVLLDAEVKPQFNLLAEDISIIRETMIPESRIEAIEDDVAVLKAAVRQINCEIRELKKAQ